MRQNLNIPLKLTQPILEYILDKGKREAFLTQSPSHESGYVIGKCNCITEGNDLTEYLIEIEKYIFSHFNISKGDLKPETMYGCLISYSENNHEVGKHRDEEPHEGYIHTRFNFLISKSKEGGNPIINDITYEVNENQLWVCFAGRDEHTTTTVKGDTPRVLLSYGYFLNNQKCKEIFP